MKQQKESRAPDLPHPFFFLCWTPNYFISLHYLDFVIVQEPNPLTQTQIPTISSFEVLDGKFLLFSKMGSWFSVCLVREMARVEWVSQKQGKKMESWIDNMRRVCWESVCVIYKYIYSMIYGLEGEGVCLGQRQHVSLTHLECTPCSNEISFPFFQL
jgi:hypothetical protein